MSSCRKPEIQKKILKSPTSSEFAIFINKQRSKITNYVYFIMFLQPFNWFLKIEKFKKIKVKPSVGFEPAISGFWGYETPAQ